MNLNSIKILLLVFLTACSFHAALAQSWEIGAFGGGAGYMGDLNPVKPYSVNNMAYGIIAKRNFDGYWSLKLSILHGKISAADSVSDNEQQRMRNLSFFSPLTEAGLQIEFNFFNYIPSLSRKRYSPYLFAGAGIVLFNPKAKYMGETYELNTLRTENQAPASPYRKYALSVPYGAGFKYNILRNWTLSAELGYRTTSTDYLDDVSGRYYDLSRLDPSNPRDRLRIALSDRSPEKGFPANDPRTQRGDFRPRDTYFFTGFTLTYTFLGSKCPPVQ
ncbi:DUF6089 family protein [Arcticibacter tournemirensis]|uniref:DUF6089 domain-containing protein n=1 Tax=Arcticibacter tournemirensis TaxID=699437 RepID=A0A4Q0M2C7_9SPHI|nr:DUF6089 family protein [Arcticibacter tournemirensis]RXF67000.1 hypothetical protein EKH83_21130 [Arcticibacter tournemirensis]